MARDKHFALVREGVAIHERFQYARALPLFEKALELCPGCFVATYNKANSLHMLGRHVEAQKILLGLVRTDEDTLATSCPESAQSPRSIVLDAYNLLFLTTLYASDSWKAALPFFREHLRRRTRGLVSVWSKRQVVSDAEELRLEFAPKAKPVPSWAS